MQISTWVVNESASRRCFPQHHKGSERPAEPDEEVKTCELRTGDKKCCRCNMEKKYYEREAGGANGENIGCL